MHLGCAQDVCYAFMNFIAGLEGDCSCVGHLGLGHWCIQDSRTSQAEVSIAVHWDRSTVLHMGAMWLEGMFVPNGLVWGYMPW